jgi:hypothetical protein
MAEVERWRDTGHLERAVETAGGQDAFDAAMGDMNTCARHRCHRWGFIPPSDTSFSGISPSRSANLDWSEDDLRTPSWHPRLVPLTGVPRQRI